MADKFVIVGSTMTGCALAFALAVLFILAWVALLIACLWVI